LLLVRLAILGEGGGGEDGGSGALLDGIASRSSITNSSGFKRIPAGCSPLSMWVKLAAVGVSGLGDESVSVIGEVDSPTEWLGW